MRSLRECFGTGRIGWNRSPFGVEQLEIRRHEPPVNGGLQGRENRGFGSPAKLTNCGGVRKTCTAAHPVIAEYFRPAPPRFFRLVRACSIGMTFSLRNQRGPFRPVRISPVFASRSSSQIQNRRRKVSLSSSSSSVSGLRRINGTSLTDVFLPY